MGNYTSLSRSTAFCYRKGGAGKGARKRKKRQEVSRRMEEDGTLFRQQFFVRIETVQYELSSRGLKDNSNYVGNSLMHHVTILEPPQLRELVDALDQIV